MAKVNPSQIPQHEDSYDNNCVLPTDYLKRSSPNSLRGDECHLSDSPSEKGMKATHAKYK